MSRVSLPRRGQTIGAVLPPLGGGGVAPGRAGAGPGAPGRAANLAGPAPGGLLLPAAPGGLGATLWQGPGLLLLPGPFVFGLVVHPAER